MLLLSCAKSHMLSASQRQPHLIHVSAVDRRQTWSIDKSIGDWLTRCDIVWISPQSHNSLSVKPHFLWHALQWPWPVRKRFSRDHWHRWRSKPGSRIVGSTTKVELTTVADCQSSLHRLVTSIDIIRLNDTITQNAYHSNRTNITRQLAAYIFTELAEFRLPVVLQTKLECCTETDKTTTVKKLQPQRSYLNLPIHPAFNWLNFLVIMMHLVNEVFWDNQSKMHALLMPNSAKCSRQTLKGCLWH